MTALTRALLWYVAHAERVSVDMSIHVSVHLVEEDVEGGVGLRVNRDFPERLEDVVEHLLEVLPPRV